MKKLYFILTAFVFSNIGFAQSDVVKFQADIVNRNGDIVYIKDNQNKTVQEIKINDKGIFKASFPITNGMYNMFDGVEYAQLYLKNGYDIKMTMDAAKFDESIKFEGEGSKENNYLAQETISESTYGYDQILTLDPDNFKKVLEQKNNADIEKMNQAGLDADFIVLHKNDLAMNMMGLQQYYIKKLASRKMNNSKAPNFDYENHAGGKTTLESLKGKYVYVDVWATWCGPCRAEIPSLKKMEADFHGKNIAFVSVSVDAEKDHDKWKTFVTEKELSGVQLYAGKTVLSEFIKTFEVNTIPRFILIDPAGNVVDADAARPSDPKLKQQLDSLLQ